MNVTTAIAARRTVYKFRPEPVAPDVVRQLLAGAVWAPNHKLSEPWTFYVLGEATKERYCQRRRQLRLELFKDPTSERALASAQSAYDMMHLAPVVLVVTSRVLPDDPLRTQEDYAATCCAVQNILLGAWEAGLGCYWGTGPLARDHEGRAILGLSDSEQIAGIVLMGYPAEVPDSRRTDATEKTRWLP